jgi:hypothetical protein
MGRHELHRHWTLQPNVLRPEHSSHGALIDPCFNPISSAQDLTDWVG